MRGVPKRPTLATLIALGAGALLAASAASPASAAPVLTPVIAAISPDPISSADSALLDITGVDFEAGDDVTFSDEHGVLIAIVIPHLVSSSELTVTAPALPAGIAQVRVRAGVVESNVVALTVLDPPVVDGLSPDAGYEAGGELVTIHGTGLGAATDVRFGTASADVVAASETQLSVLTPAGFGPVDVVVTTPIGTSAPVTFAYATAALTDPAPAATPTSEPTVEPTAADRRELAATGIDLRWTGAALAAGLVLSGAGVALRWRRRRSG
jgi:hypothetical protein